MRGIVDTGVGADVVVEPDILRDDPGGGMSTDGVGMDLGGGRGAGGDGERVGRTGGGSIYETGTSETSPTLPSINGDRAWGDVDGSITTPLRRGEPGRNGEVLCSGEEAESRASEAAEGVWVCDVRRGDDGSAGRVSRSGIRLKVDVFRLCGGDFCIDSGGLGGEPGPGPLLDDGSGCANCSEESASLRWNPFGREVGNILGLNGLGFLVVFCMPLVEGD